MTQVIDLVDSIEYTRSNCFGHQLHYSLHNECSDIVTVPLNKIHNYPNPKRILSRLKQRTLFKNAEQIRDWCRDTPVVVFDQDPWQAFMDDSPYKGAYSHIMKFINVKSFALTTQWWVDYLNNTGMPSTFAKMGILPQYCVKRPDYLDRQSVVGFVGSVHPRRQQLLDIIENSGIRTNVLRTNSLAYPEFLKNLSNLRIFVHNEDMTFFVDGKELNFNTGMWIKDVEAMSQGCFSIRSKANGSESYLDKLSSIKLYDNIEQVPDIIRKIESMNVSERQKMIDNTVLQIFKENVWANTSRKLIELTDNSLNK